MSRSESCGVLTVDATHLPPQGAVMAFDFGMARIGVAAGGVESGVATPLTTLKAESGRPNWTEIGRLVDEYEPAAFVVGQPPEAAAAMAASLRAFVRGLRKRHGLEVLLYDEAASSSEARARIRELRASGMRKRTAAGDIDKIAAAIILEDCLNRVV